MKNKLFLILFVFLGFGISNVSALEVTPTPLPKSINGGVVNGKAVSLPKPEYPAAAQAVRAGGEVKVQVVIDEQGNIISATAVSGHPLLRQAAEQAAAGAIFKPTTLSGQPVKVTGVIVYNFVPSQPPVEEEAPVWAFGMMLSFIQNTDSTLIKELDDKNEFDSILNEMANDIPKEFEAEKPLFDKLAKAQGSERQKIAGDLIVSIKKYLNAGENWQIEVGLHLGAAMPELLKHIRNTAEDNKPADGAQLKTNLQKIKDSLLIAPPEVSAELIKKFKSVADFADAKDLSSPETLSALMSAIEPLFGSFSDE